MSSEMIAAAEGFQMVHFDIEGTDMCPNIIPLWRHS